MPSEPPRLYVSHDADLHWLIALEYGRVGEDQPQACWVPLSETFAYLLDAPDGHIVGFRVNAFDTFDPDDPEVEAIWDAPRFDVPTLGLMHATAGEIAIAARRRFGETDSLNRKIFGVATGHQGEEALEHWRNCLESGDGMAHFALGYTLMELDRPQEAYAHLRHYTEIAPMGAWNWCWYGQAAEAVGELREARRAYRRAIELDEDGEEGAGVDAAARLEPLPDILGAHGVGAPGPGAPELGAPGTGAVRLPDASLMAQETAGTADDPDVVVDAAETGTLSYDGEDFPEHGERERDGVSDHLAAGITAGGRPKSYAHTDPNEDAVRVLRSGDATVIVVCDGHRGESSARLAAGLLAEVLGEDPHALHDEDDLLGMLLVVNGYVREETAAASQPESRTTLALAVVEGGRVRWVHMGDSLLAVVDPDGEVRRLGEPRHLFLGWPMDRAGVDAAVQPGVEPSRTLTGPTDPRAPAGASGGRPARRGRTGAGPETR